ncbi:hypothetical protein L218DRAFT_863241, partial [Marasmius fiardii PR-910]
YLAINSVWLAMTYLLANYTIAKAVNGDGKEIDPVVEYTAGISRCVIAWRWLEMSFTTRHYLLKSSLSAILVILIVGSC